MSWNQFEELKGYVSNASKRTPSHGNFRRTFSRKTRTILKRKPNPSTTPKISVGATAADIDGFSSSDEGEAHKEDKVPQTRGLKVKRKIQKRCLKRTEEFSPATLRNPQESHPVSNTASSPLSPEFPSKEENKTTFNWNKKTRECGTTERKPEDDIAWSASGSSDEETHQEVEEKDLLEGQDSGSETHSPRCLYSSTQDRTSPFCTTAMDAVPAPMEVISEFGSSAEEDQSNAMSDEVDISPPTPSQDGTGAAVAPVIARTASEWMKHVHVKESEECDLAGEGEWLLDSAKKKKRKWKKLGLADQLQRLIARENAERAFWDHRLADLQQSEESVAGRPASNVLTMQVISQLQHCSHHFTRCYLISTEQLHTAQQNSPIVDVAFVAETSKQLGLRVGSCIRIHPPWQKLEVPSLPYPILLCTYYCEKLLTPPGSPLIDLTGIEDIAVQRPIPGPSLLHNKPGLLHSPRKGFQPTKLLFGEPEEEADVTEQGGESECPYKDNELPFMQGTVGCSYKDSKLSVVQAESPDKTVSKNVPPSTISKAIELQGGCSGGRVSFSALLQRVYRKRVKRASTDHKERDLSLSQSLVSEAFSLDKNEEVRWNLLVQDSHGIFCEIVVPSEFATQKHWKLCIERGEGNNFSFTDLRVVQRTNGTRSPGLFSVISSMWPHTDSPSSSERCCSQIVAQVSQEELAASQGSSPLGFCYVLMVQTDSSVTELNITVSSNERQASYRVPSLCQLGDILDFSGMTPSRVSFYGVLLFAKRSKTRAVGQGSSVVWTLYMADGSLQRTRQSPQDNRPHDDGSRNCYYVKTNVLSSHVLDDNEARIFGRSGVRLFMKDLVYSSENKDAYSVIKEVDEKFSTTQVGMAKNDFTEMFHVPNLLLPDLTSESREGMLYGVEGSIVDVDEDAAFCWLECDNCGDPNITEEPDIRSTYHCDNCGSKVTSPRTRIHLEIFLRCATCPDTVVKIQLQQRTVESLLPVSYQESEQGYDIDSVLDKKIGPIKCLLIESSLLCGDNESSLLCGVNGTSENRLILDEIPATVCSF